MAGQPVLNWEVLRVLPMAVEGFQLNGVWTGELDTDQQQLVWTKRAGMTRQQATCHLHTVVWWTVGDGVLSAGPMGEREGVGEERGKREREKGRERERETHTRRERLRGREVHRFAWPASTAGNKMGMVKNEEQEGLAYGRIDQRNHTNCTPNTTRKWPLPLPTRQRSGEEYRS